MRMKHYRVDGYVRVYNPLDRMYTSCLADAMNELRGAVRDRTEGRLMWSRNILAGLKTFIWLDRAKEDPLQLAMISFDASKRVYEDDIKQIREYIYSHFTPQEIDIARRSALGEFRRAIPLTRSDIQRIKSGKHSFSKMVNEYVVSSETIRSALNKPMSPSRRKDIGVTSGTVWRVIGLPEHRQ